MLNQSKKIVLSPGELQRKKRYLTATIITCITLVIVGGSLHVVGLGSIRMGEMRALATYNLKEESTHIRAAGEDIEIGRASCRERVCLYV